MASRNRAVAESMWRPPQAVPRRPSLRASIELRRTSGHPTADICCSGHSATATHRRRTTSTGMSRRSQAASPVRTDARNALLREGFQAFQGLPFPDAWVGAGNRILFHGSVGDSSNMWQVAHLSRDAGASAARRSGRRSARRTKRQPRSRSDGRMVFISRTMGADIWSLPIDANRGQVEGPLKRVTQDAADDYDPRCRTMAPRWCSVRGEPGVSASS